MANGSTGANVRRHGRRAVLDRGPSALRLEARVIGAEEGADVVIHVEEIRPLIPVEGHREAAEADTPPFSLHSETRLGGSPVLCPGAATSAVPR